MYSKANNEVIVSQAERAFREAFERLKNGEPIRLTKGSRISQNNVAKEAGCDPSALKKLRYPSLVEDIQTCVRDQTSCSPTPRQKILGQRKKNQQLQDRIATLLVERDRCASLLVEADATILELTRKVERLEALLPSNVINLS